MYNLHFYELMSWLASHNFFVFLIATICDFTFYERMLFVHRSNVGLAVDN